ncbi:uncharacterized protein LOC131631540 [Vicia villosa]|uniref:uncharacterized protein LOC131631540 n=1 Tax=Vicia villosa TaxID=3911 RepID=UPI00273CA1D2|nr:uncharacterized protein LOC131631540 [Vicia villosa]
MEMVKNRTARVVELNQMEESILKQKAKIDWLKLGDGNNSFFHNSIKERNKHNNMSTLTSLNGELLSNKNDISNEILNFYTGLVGTAANSIEGIDQPCILRGNTISREEALDLITPIAEHEIWEALAGIGNTKAPGIDGFNSYFFKDAWEIIKLDVIEAIQEFFRIGKMHKAMNCSIITLIPKSGEAATIKD